MKTTEKKIKVSELHTGYEDKGNEGVFAYEGKLTVRPSYQREFVYTIEKEQKVIETIQKNLPLNIMYWAKNGEDSYEVIDGQQRTISICEYLENKYPLNELLYCNIPEGELKDSIDNYELTVYICEGTEEEKLAWFRTINIAGEILNNQELLNATYHGPWLSSAKKYFSKPSCVAIEEEYIKGSPIRQDLLEQAIEWAADKDGLANSVAYMAKHQHDVNAEALWKYYDTVIKWAKKTFPHARKGITDKQKWGLLYNTYHGKVYDATVLESDIQKLLTDDDVTKQAGIIEYLLSNKDDSKIKCLSLRSFTPNQKRAKFEEQKGVCPDCKKVFKFEEMEGDHIVPWSKGGHTIPSNLTMRCKACNASKGAKLITIE